MGFLMQNQIGSSSHGNSDVSSGKSSADHKVACGSDIDVRSACLTGGGDSQVVDYTGRSDQVPRRSVSVVCSAESFVLPGI